MRAEPSKGRGAFVLLHKEAKWFKGLAWAEGSAAENNCRMGGRRGQGSKATTAGKKEGGRSDSRYACHACPPYARAPMRLSSAKG
eukprot:200735-Pleurochrysis_carterae.AAC.2